MRKDFELAAGWFQQTHRPLYLGEFGAYQEANVDDRALWTRTTQQRSFWTRIDTPCNQK